MYHITTIDIQLYTHTHQATRPYPPTQQHTLLHLHPFIPQIFYVLCLLLHNVHINEECVKPELEQLLLKNGGR